MKVVIVIRSVTLRNALNFVRDNLNCTPTHFTNSKIIATGVGSAFGIKQSRKTETYRKAKLHFIIADVVSDKLVYIKMKFNESKTYHAELVTALPYKELSLAIEHVMAFRKEYKDRRQYPRGWTAIFCDKLLELIPSIKICDRAENALQSHRHHESPDFGNAT